MAAQIPILSLARSRLIPASTTYYCPKAPFTSINAVLSTKEVDEKPKMLVITITEAITVLPFQDNFWVKVAKQRFDKIPGYPLKPGQKVG